MIRGIESFREWFKGHEEQYTIIGGTACDLLMTENGLDFRATKDIDLVLIVEAVDAQFASRFWEYVVAAGYRCLFLRMGYYGFISQITCLSAILLNTAITRPVPNIARSVPIWIPMM